MTICWNLFYKYGEFRFFHHIMVNWAHLPLKKTFVPFAPSFFFLPCCQISSQKNLFPSYSRIWLSPHKLKIRNPPSFHNQIDQIFFLANFHHLVRKTKGGFGSNKKDLGEIMAQSCHIYIIVFSMSQKYNKLEKNSTFLFDT